MAVCDVAENAADRNPSATPLQMLHAARVDDVTQTFAKLFKSFCRIETRRITCHADVSILSIVGGPAEVARRQSRIQKAVQSRRTIERNVFKDVFNTDQPFAVAIESKIPRYTRIGSISSNQKPRCHPMRASRAIQANDDAIIQWIVFGVTRRRHPLNSGQNALA